MHYFVVFQGAHCWFKIDFARQSWRALGGVPLYPKFFRHLWIIWNYSEVVRMMYDNVIHLGSQVIFSSTTSTPIKRLLGLFDRQISSFDSLITGNYRPKIAILQSRNNCWLSQKTAIKIFSSVCRIEMMKTQWRLSVEWRTKTCHVKHEAVCLASGQRRMGAIFWFKNNDELIKINSQQLIWRSAARCWF